MENLRERARRYGILDEYVDQSGKERRPTSDATRAALVEAMGTADVEEPAALERVAVVREGAPSRLEIRAGESVNWQLRVRLESGEERTQEGRGDRTLDLGVLPCGYHDLALELGSSVHSQRRIVTPERCPSVLEVTGGERAFGVTAQLYAVRSRDNWGVGDCGDIDRLVDRAAAWGASFVGLNPLHALRNEGSDISPYSPISRLFGNWLYIDLAAVPEHDGTEPSNVAALRDAASIDYDRISGLKRAALRKAFDRFAASGSRDRREAFAAHRAAGGRDLENFALYSTMTADERARFPRPDAPGIEALRGRDDVTFACWLQFELDRQLSRAAARARERGLPIGLYQDLAIGCAGDSSDVWANPALFVTGVSVGAPPDGYSKDGQNWGLPPMNPLRLRREAYRFWTTLLRRGFAHGGALRMDHVIGLFRQFWIPNGKSGREGAYVAFPAEDLLGILALEATRARAVVVGEDLGTVPEEVPGVLERYGVLSSRVLYFEVANGEFRPSAEYRAPALTTVNTHDMAPLAGWLEATDVKVKEHVGILDAVAAEDARSARVKEVAALQRRLALELGTAPSKEDFAGAVHAFLAKTPSVLVGVALDDVTGETEPINVPGTTPEQHPNWRRRYALALEDLPASPSALPRALRER